MKTIFIMIATLLIGFTAHAGYLLDDMSNMNTAGVKMSGDLKWPSSGNYAVHYLTAGDGDSIQVLTTSSSPFGGGFSVRADGGILLDATNSGSWEASTAAGSYNDMDFNADYNFVVMPGQSGSLVILGKPLNLQPSNPEPTCSQGAGSTEGTLYYTMSNPGVSAGKLELCTCDASGACAWVTK